MRVTTQNLPNSFSSSNKKQKAALPETAPRASILAKATSRGQLTNWQRRSNHERFTRLTGISDKWRVMAVYPKKAMKALQYGSKLRG
jgi:hypothetical protein